MRITLFTAFYPFRGGIAQFNERLVEEFDKEHKVEVFTFKKQYPHWLFPGTSQYVKEPNNRYYLRAFRVVSTFNPLTYFSGAKKIRNSKPEIFIANYWMTIFAPFLLLLSAKLKGRCKRILLVHNFWPHEPRFFDSWLNELILKSFDSVVVLSEKVKTDILACNKKIPVKLLFHPWYDHFHSLIPKEDIRRKLGVPIEAKVLLFFGLIRDYKGLDLLLTSFKHLDESYFLIIAGEFYGDKHVYDPWLNDLQLRERILLADYFVPDDQVHQYFSAADVCVLPYKSATQSGVTATAFYFGLPAIVTDVGGLSDVVGQKGVVVPANNPTELVEGITFLFEKDHLEKCKLAIELERSRFSWENFSRELLEFAKEQ
jgi:glycosyltransferase involved in cell wall biosynthesis